MFQIKLKKPNINVVAKVGEPATRVVDKEAGRVSFKNNSLSYVILYSYRNIARVYRVCFLRTTNSIVYEERAVDSNCGIIHQ